MRSASCRLPWNYQNPNVVQHMLNDISKLRKFRGSSSLKPKPILRIGIDEPAIACLEFFKILMPISIHAQQRRILEIQNQMAIKRHLSHVSSKFGF
jgi:hypothetical protein